MVMFVRFLICCFFSLSVFSQELPTLESSSGHFAELRVKFHYDVHQIGQTRNTKPLAFYRVDTKRTLMTYSSRMKGTIYSKYNIDAFNFVTGGATTKLDLSGRGFTSYLRGNKWQTSQVSSNWLSPQAITAAKEEAKLPSNFPALLWGTKSYKVGESSSVEDEQAKEFLFYLFRQFLPTEKGVAVFQTDLSECSIEVTPQEIGATSKLALQISFAFSDGSKGILEGALEVAEDKYFLKLEGNCEQLFEGSSMAGKLTIEMDKELLKSTAEDHQLKNKIVGKTWETKLAKDGSDFTIVDNFEENGRHNGMISEEYSSGIHTLETDGYWQVLEGKFYYVGWIDTTPCTEIYTITEINDKELHYKKAEEDKIFVAFAQE